MRSLPCKKCKRIMSGIVDYETREHCIACGGENLMDSKAELERRQEERETQ